MTASEARSPIGTTSASYVCPRDLDERPNHDLLHVLRRKIGPPLPAPRRYPFGNRFSDNNRRGERDPMILRPGWPHRGPRSLQDLVGPLSQHADCLTYH